MIARSILDLGSSPYRGLMPYLPEDADFFFGRSKEIRRLQASVFGSPLTLVYGPSGVGKSSVLNAGLMHGIDQRGDLIGFSFNSWSDGDAAAAVARLVYSAALDRGADVVDDDDPVELMQRTAVAVEEHAEDRKLRLPIVVVLDQFEDATKYRERNGGFDDWFVEVVTEFGNNVSFVVAIREDNITLLDRFEGRIPQLFDNYMRVDYLDRDAATEAIVKPLERWVGTPGGLAAGAQPVPSQQVDDLIVREPLIERVLDGVAVRGDSRLAAGRSLSAEDEGRIETAYLQLVMATMWEHRQRGPMTSALYEEMGTADGIANSYVSSVMTNLSDRDRQLTSLMIPHLVTASGLKLAQHASDIADRVKRDEVELADVLTRLEESGRILRALDPPDVSPASRRFEPFHDRIAEALRTWKNEQDAADPTERQRRRAQRDLRSAIDGIGDPRPDKWQRALRQLVGLAFQTFDRDIADRALEELQKLQASSNRRLKEEARKAIGELKAASVDQIVSQITNILSDLVRTDDDLNVLGTDHDPLTSPSRVPVAHLEPASLDAEIDDIASFTAELHEMARSDGDVGERSRDGLEQLRRFWRGELAQVRSVLLDRGERTHVETVERIAEQWGLSVQDLDQAEDAPGEYTSGLGDEMPAWIRILVLGIAGSIGLVVGEVVSSWWLVRSGRPPFDEMVPPFLAFGVVVALSVASIVSERWIDDSEELALNAIGLAAGIAAAWLAITALALMISVTFGVGFWWPMWIGGALIGAWVVAVAYEY